MTDRPGLQPLKINRALIGLIAILLLAIGGILWLVLGNQDMWTGACLKVGTLMAAVWLALPTKLHHHHWGHVSWVSVIGFVALIVTLTGKRVDFRIVLAILFGVTIAYIFLRPRSK